MAYNSAMYDTAFRPMWGLYLVCFLFVSGIHAQKSHDFQQKILSLAPTADAAVIPISAWSTGDWSKETAPRFSVIVGTGFLIDRDGHFITAAHVVNTKQIAGVDVRLTATIRQKSGDSTGAAFTIIKIDSDHDLALCQVDGFKVFLPSQSPIVKAMAAEAAKPLPPGTVRTDARHPFASLRVASSPPATGELVLLSGFPLGSWTPTLQLGLVAATNTLYPPPAPALGVKDGGQLLQISVNGNHGNSGGPIIDLTTGDVIGVLLQLVPAPITIGGKQYYDAGTFEMSGLMLAAPAAWVDELLSRNSVHSEGIRSGKFLIW